MEAKQGNWDDSTLNRVSDTLNDLNNLLDVNEPWTFIVDDPTGTCICKPETSLNVEYYDAPEAPANSFASIIREQQRLMQQQEAEN